MVASLWAPGSSTFAAAVVYEQCPEAEPMAGRPPAHSPGVRLLINRARQLGADAIILDAFGGEERAACLGIH